MLRTFFISLGTVVILAPATWACDLCAVYTALEPKQPTSHGVRLGIAEQVTNYDKIQSNGTYKENTAGQSMLSSITQLYGVYDINDSVSLQLTLPYISRRFTRADEDKTEKGVEAGIGDVSLIARYRPLDLREDDDIFIVEVFGGVKLPTGDSDRLGEERASGHQHEEIGEEPFEPHHEVHGEVHDEAVEHSHHRALKHGGIVHGDEDKGVQSTIHGHDLALGSGSYDFPIGFALHAQRSRLFWDAEVQYMLRTRGDFDYEHADDLLWETGPGYFVSLDEESSIAVKANFSGEYKRKDNILGVAQGDTGINSVFLGPKVLIARGSFTAELGWDVPLSIENSGTQTVVENRFRAALTYTF